MFETLPNVTVTSYTRATRRYDVTLSALHVRTLKEIKCIGKSSGFDV